VFGPSGEDRPDVLTDAETVVLPAWLHHRPGSAEKKTPESTAAFLKSITLPAHLGNAPATRRGTGKPSARDTEAEAASGGGRAGTAAGPAAGESGEIQPADAGQGKDLLDDHRAAEQIAELQTGESDDRD